MSGSRQVKGNEVSKSRILKGHTRHLSWVADDTKHIFQAATARCFYNQLHRVKFQVIFCHHFPWVCNAKYYWNCLWWYYLNKGSLPLITISNLQKQGYFFFLFIIMIDLWVEACRLFILRVVLTPFPFQSFLPQRPPSTRRHLMKQMSSMQNCIHIKRHH